MKKFKFLKIIGIILATIILFFTAINVIPPKKVVKDNPFIVAKGDKPLVGAHRGGMASRPENTMLAFKTSVNEWDVDIIESDLHLTADGHLVFNHNSYVDETCNINGDFPLEAVKELCNDEKYRHKIEDMNLKDLKQYNFGYYFESSDGNRPYKNVTDIAAEGLQITTLEELFEEFYEQKPDLLFILEIKSKGEAGVKSCEVLNDILNKYPDYRDNVVIGSYDSAVEREIQKNYPDILTGASTDSAKSFIITQFLGVNLFNKSDFACLQIPWSYSLKGKYISLDRSTIIKRAHRKNIAVQYWTINDVEQMRRLIDLGCDCIITDDPELLNTVLEVYDKF